MKYKFSRFFHIIQGENDRVCCYNALTMKCAYSTMAQVDDVKKYITSKMDDDEVEKSELLGQLIELRMVISEEFNEENLIKKIRKEVFNGVKIRVMVLHMTDYCNLKCKYCFIEGGQPDGYVRKKMEKETARAAVDKFVSILKKNGTYNKKPSIVFYGGEPLSNWDVLRFAVEYIAEKEKIEKIKIDKVIITNGVLLEESMIETIKKYGVLLSVSIDGDEELHNFNRIDYNNEGSHERVVKGIKLLHDHDVEPAVSCVMAKEGVHKSAETLEYLVNKLGVRGIGFNHVSIIPGLNYYDKEYEDNFADAIIEVQKIIQEKYPYVYERRMGHKVNTFIDKKLIKSDCTGCGEQISVSTDGYIGICQGYMGSRKTFNNTVFDEDYYPMDDETFIEWSNRAPLNIEKCLDCVALATCGGGCPRNADMINGSIWEVDSAFCHFAKKAQEWLVWQTIEEDD